MRIGEINKDNYTEYLKLFGGKNSKALDSMLGKDEKTNNTEKAFDPSKFIGEGCVDVTGRTDWKKIVPVSDDIREQIYNITRNEFIEDNGMTDGEVFRAATNKYIRSRPLDERASVAWTIDQIKIDESLRLYDYVKAKVPGWDWGKPFDKSILDGYVSGGLDIKA